MMKKRRGRMYRVLLVLVLIGVGLVIYQTQQYQEGLEEEPPAQEEAPVKEEREVTDETEKESSSQPEMTSDEKIDALIEKMTLEEKIGQLMVIGFESTEVNDHAVKMIEDYHVGGIILYDRNMETPEQVTTLNKDLQALAKETRNEIPLIISVDQEGGDIVRMREHVSEIPSQQELGTRGNSEEIYSIAKRNGEELEDMGFNVNYAPVIDLSDTDSRSFGKDPEKAYDFGKQAVKGFTDANITATLKHFPGHGRSNVDPHIESSTVDADKLDLENSDIFPFKQMIDNVDHHDYFVMVTHFIYPAYDKKLPASISPVIIQDLLREQLGYEGIVVTDDLEMGAVTDLYSYEELGYQAVKAGADLLLVCHTLENQEKVYNGILNAVKEGKLTEQQINNSVKRILQHKQDM